MKYKERTQEEFDGEVTAGEDDTVLLFLDSFVYPSQCFNSDEIMFKQPVTLQQIRILRPDSSPHPNVVAAPRFPSSHL